MKKNCCSCIKSITIYDHGAYWKDNFGRTIRGQQYGPANRVLKGSDIRPLCPYLCDDAFLYLEGCQVGNTNDNTLGKHAFDMLFGACKKIKVIRACPGDNYWTSSGHSYCAGGYRYFVK